MFGPLLLADLAYLAASSLKIVDGGWLPLATALVIGHVVTIWRRGRGIPWDKLCGHSLATRSSVAKLDPKLTGVKGTAVFMTGNPDVVPNALLHNLKHNRVLHERVLLAAARVGDVPFVPEECRVGLEEPGKGFWKAAVAYGFMDRPDIPKVPERCRAPGLDVDPMLTSFFLARETPIPSPRRRMSRLAERLFIPPATAALPVTAYFGVPPNRAVELGTQVEV